MTTIEVIIKMIGKIYFVEACGGDWQPDCKDILSSGCVSCCNGHELIEEFKKREDPEKDDTVCKYCGEAH